jgi:RNA polymerase sigma-70 factor (ECF subfamily)
MNPPPKGFADDADFDLLLAQARRGDAAALGRLVDGCRQYLLQIANRELDSEIVPKEGPSDQVQDSLLEAQRDFSGFTGRTSTELLAWLRRILINNIRDATGRHKGVAKRQLDKERPLDAQEHAKVGLELRDDGPSPSDELMRSERRDAVLAAVSRLSPRQQDVIRLVQEGLSYEAIGHRLQTSGEAVRKVHVRALEELRGMLRDLVE